MEFKLKAISPEGIEAALSKAEVYRFLNEPEEAESICQDVLAIQPGHQLALRTLGLALTDQFTGDGSDPYSAAVNAFQQLTDAYEQFWDCLESDTPTGEDSPAADDLPSDAYGQFWQLSDA